MNENSLDNKKELEEAREKLKQMQKQCEVERNKGLKTFQNLAQYKSEKMYDMVMNYGDHHSS